MKNSKLCLVTAFVLSCGTIHAGNVVTDWNTIASTTIVTNGAKSPGASSVWFAYTSLAVYDAVNAISGQYRPFYYRIAGPANASIGAQQSRPRTAYWSTISHRKRLHWTVNLQHR